MEVRKIGVVGSGLMGAGIAQIAAVAGFDVVVYDISMDLVEKGINRIDLSLGKMVQKNKINNKDKKDIIDRRVKSEDLHDLSDAEIIFEAIIENAGSKKELFASLDSICGKDCIFATNTSGLSITDIASSTKRKNKFIGAHFFNPVPVMGLLEIIRGYDTDDTTYEAVANIGKKFGKEIITVKEAPLFCVNRILVPMINEAIFVLSEGIASAEDIDKGMCLGANHPIGPLALADLIGLDTLLDVTETLYREMSDSKYRPCPLLKKLVRAGCLGRKAGKGFYTYTNDG
jgi:3-hydroxybutyryl-CoA dehydrogenase